MRTWRTAVMLTRCGAEPDCTIHPGEPYLELRGNETSWLKRRCERHAGESVNHDQLVMDARIDGAAKLLVPRFAPVGDLVTDYKARAARNDA